MNFPGDNLGSRHAVPAKWGGSNSPIIDNTIELRAIHAGNCNLLSSVFAKEFSKKDMVRKYHKLSAVAWIEIENLWRKGEVTLAELSEAYGVSTRALQSHFAKAGITKGEQAAAMAVAAKEAIEAEDLSDRDRLVSRAKEIRERTYRHATAVEDLVMAQLEIAQHDPSQTHRVASALKGISLAATALERLHGLKYRALGLDKDDALPHELPVLQIVNLTREEISRLRERNGDDDYDDDGEDLDDEDNEVVTTGFDDDACPMVEEGLIDTTTTAPAEYDAEGYRLVRNAKR